LVDTRATVGSVVDHHRKRRDGSMTTRRIIQLTTISTLTLAAALAGTGGTAVAQTGEVTSQVCGVVGQTGGIAPNISALVPVLAVPIGTQVNPC
jgi:hypothetical protein